MEFEGEFLFYQKWTGKGYDDGNVVYELNEGSGNMITFHYNGKISFEGFFMNLKRMEQEKNMIKIVI